MNNFQLSIPTKIVFGKNQISQLATCIPKRSKVLLLFGGGSIKKNGVYDQVISALADYQFMEFGGISANPEYDVLLEALQVIKEESITYLLAVGGGSVIDGTKFLSSAALFQGDDPWQILEKGIRTEVGMPFGTVLTIPATGSEMNSGAVITRASSKQKLSMGGPGLFPEFSIMDPQVVFSLPKRQLSNGIADAFCHVMEQYMTYNTESWLQDRIAESIMQTLVELAPKILVDQHDYDSAANLMWCCTMALNGIIQKGVACDWVIHAIGHELTALYGIDHARTLAIIAEHHYQISFNQKQERLAQFGKRVWGLKEEGDKEIGKEAIRRMSLFFNSLGIDTKLSMYTKDYEGTAETIRDRFINRGLTAIGEKKNITPSIVEEIVKASY